MSHTDYLLVCHFYVLAVPDGMSPVTNVCFLISTFRLILVRVLMGKIGQVSDLYLPVKPQNLLCIYILNIALLIS